jgi:transcriptional regulator with XRE-family HTH domain
MVGHDVAYARICNPFVACSEKIRHLVSYMPRPARQKSPIRDLRAIIGKSQREFARSLGISPSALKRIENNDLGLSRKVALKIQLETAIDRRCLKGNLRTLRNVRGEQYTKEFYKAWKEHYSWQDEHMVKHLTGLLNSAMETLLQASVFGYRRRLSQVFAEIADALERCRVDFDLERPTNAILAKQRSPWTGRPLKWEDLQLGVDAAFTATRKPRPSSRRRRKA